MYAFPGVHLISRKGPSQFGDHLPNVLYLVPISNNAFQTKSPSANCLTFIFLL
jgi:hypothetical protein